jgi:hypothetical protein
VGPDLHRAQARHTPVQGRLLVRGKTGQKADS